MKSIVLLISIFAIVTPNFCNAGKMDVPEETLKECRNEHHISEDDAKRYEENLMTDKLSEEEEKKAGCFFGCVMEKEAYVHEDSVQLDQWRERMAEKAADEDVEAMYAQLEECADHAESFDDGCHKMYKFLQCMIPTIKQLEAVEEDE